MKNLRDDNINMTEELYFQPILPKETTPEENAAWEFASQSDLLLVAEKSFLAGIEWEKKRCSSLDKELKEIINDSFGIDLNANDFFRYACAESVCLDPKDLIWVLPVYKKYEMDGLNACMAYIAQEKPLPPYLTAKYENAYAEIERLNPKVYSEH